MKQIAILILIVIIHTSSFACDCKEIKRDSAVIVGLRNSDMVFTGELIKSDFENNTFSFSIFELFKGDYKRDTIWGKAFSNCSIFPTVKGIWIVYAEKLNDTTIELNGCLRSMALQRAEGIIPPPPPEFSENDEPINTLKYQLQKLEKRTEGIAIWFNDYEKLKKITKKNHHQAIKGKDNDSKNAFEIKDILLGFFMLTNIILLIVLIRKKKNASC
ncbi:hypothetical protein EC396_04275 [Lutibacter sp. HS1-25]|uniref:hypothetical protein n=1 Tax=Lutibacter sp. HS1-25 TaxID=2485000 RepID=UPI0010109964|nr:hypothetical protein [Lutibacter sp. HS1-25]RXP60876.1 hypothetical protein EC396_04275 [Lutibacter sp. HS1-25]